MVVKKLNRPKQIIVLSIVALFLLSVVVGVVYTVFTAGNGNIKPDPIIDESDDELLSIDSEPAAAAENTRAPGGTLKWAIQIGDEELSTPAICDLDSSVTGGDTKYEVVVGGASDIVAAVNNNGNLRWSYTDCVIDNAHVLAAGLDFDPAPFFSSISPVDLQGNTGAEVLIGEQDGVLCLKSDGTMYWKDKGTTDGYYFSSIAVTDLEGDFAGVNVDGDDVGRKDDLEILLGSDNSANADAFLECWQANGDVVFRNKVDLSFEHAFMTCSIVATEMDGWFARDDEKVLEALRDNDPNGRPDTLWADFLMSTHAYPGRIWQYDSSHSWGENELYHEAAAVSAPGHYGGHESYATPAVGNFTGGPELEAIMGHGSGMPTWQGSDGTIRMYRQDGVEVATAFTTGPAPSSVFSSPAACDAQNVDEKDLDEGEFIEYEVYFGCDNGYVYCLKASDLTELWKYETGGRILSSPAVCNINSDDSLEIIIGSNDGKVYCFEADPMEYDLEGNSNPKDDGMTDDGGKYGTYDKLWEFDLRAQEGSVGDEKVGISSPVVGDLDRDGSLEVLIGDDKGKLWCINAGGTCVPGQVDWPMFHNDVNKTGFYNPGTSYGVRVDRGKAEIDGQLGPEKLSKSVKPGEFVTYNITVTNIGASQTFSDVDTFWLDMNQAVYKFGDAQEEHGWPVAELTGDLLRWGTDPDDSTYKPYLTLRSMQGTNLTLKVSAPWSGDLSELCQVEISAHSQNDSYARDSILTKTSLELNLDFDISIVKEPVKDKDDELFGQKVIKINPSDKATLDVYVNNKGNINDTYDLRIMGYIGDWNAYFEEEGDDDDDLTELGPLDALIMADQFPSAYQGSDGVVKFTIEAPADADESEMLTLKVLATSRYSKTSDYLDNITKFDYLIVEVNPIPDLELKCRQPRKYVTAGDNVTFEVDVINRGNSRVSVKLEYSQLKAGWHLEFRNDMNEPFLGGDVIIDVMNEAEATILVVLGAPSSAPAGDSQNVVIKGTTQGDSALVSKDSVALTAFVSQFFDVNVTVTPKTLWVDPGSIVNYNISITNLGNGKDFVIITPTLLEVNWESTFYLGTEERVTSELPHNESVDFRMQISIPRTQLAGTYKIGINVTSLGDQEIVYFEAGINKIFNLTAYGVVHSELTSDKVLSEIIEPSPGVSPGSILNFVFELTNGGNDPDWIDLSLVPMKPSHTRSSDLNKAEWSEFEELGWEGYFIGITNTEAYMTDVEDRDFSEDLDLSHETAPVGYLNDGNMTIRDLKLRIGVGQRIWLKAQITVPRDVPEVDDSVHPNRNEPWTFMLECYSADPEGKNKDIDLSDNRVDVALNILLPDLVVVGNVRHPKSIGNGEIVTISGEVRNIGDIEAKEVIVTFYVDGKEVKSQTIHVLENGNSRLIPFTWQAAGGDHELKIKVDPEDAIVEKDETNNEQTKTVNVQSGGIVELLSNREVCSILPVIIVIALIAIILVIIKKRGSFLGLKPGGGEEY